MEKDYITVNKDAYNKLAKEYDERQYIIKDEFYKSVLFGNLGFEKGKTLLEIGPGRGARLKNFCEFGLEVTAIELSEEMSKLSMQRAPKAKIINKNVFECDFEDKFDFIYMEAVIHNFPKEDAKKLLKLVHKWLKDDGIFICTTTVDDSDYEGYQEKQDYESKTKRFRHHYTKNTFENLFKEENFNIINKIYKEEKDETRKKLWQVLYLGK